MNVEEFESYSADLLATLSDDANQEEAPANKSGLPALMEEIDGTLDPIDDSFGFPTFNDIARSSQENYDTVRDAYSLMGIEALAFYKSFRFISVAPFPGKWGIFILDFGIDAIAKQAQEFNSFMPEAESREFASRLLLSHERYHFSVDVWALGQEVSILNGSRVKRYAYYLRKKQATELTEWDIEESLANHYAFRALSRFRFSDGSTANSLARKILESGPVPYCDFFLNPEVRIKKEGSLALAVANGLDVRTTTVAARIANIDPRILSVSIEPTRSTHPFGSVSICPAYKVHTTNYISLVQPFVGPDLSEFKKFVVKYLNGKFLERTDHDYYRIDNNEKVKIPNPHERQVKGRELKGTLFKAGMQHADYVRERQSTRCWNIHCPRPSAKPPLAIG